LAKGNGIQNEDNLSSTLLLGYIVSDTDRAMNS